MALGRFPPAAQQPSSTFPASSFGHPVPRPSKQLPNLQLSRKPPRRIWNRATPLDQSAEPSTPSTALPWERPSSWKQLQGVTDPDEHGGERSDSRSIMESQPDPPNRRARPRLAGNRTCAAQTGLTLQPHLESPIARSPGECVDCTRIKAMGKYGAGQDECWTCQSGGRKDRPIRPQDPHELPPSTCHNPFTSKSANNSDRNECSNQRKPLGSLQLSSRARAQDRNRVPFRRTVVSSLMTSTEIIRVLKNHGCVDLTSQLVLSSCSAFAVLNGGFGDVYSATLSTGARVAIKVFRFRLTQEQSGKHLKHAARELHTWSKCQHPNVLGLLGLVEFRGQLGMVSPWMDNGCLGSYIEQNPHVDRYQLCYHICEGLSYLHRIQIVHGDLKGANVLISNDGVPLLADFGNSHLSNQSLQFTKTVSGTAVSPRWTAPEVLDGRVGSSYAADIFSLGMTLLEAITGNVPYHELERDIAVTSAILVKKVVPSRSEAYFPTGNDHDNEFWDLLVWCWEYEPEARPDAKQVLDSIHQIKLMRAFFTLLSSSKRTSRDSLPAEPTTPARRTKRSTKGRTHDNFPLPHASPSSALIKSHTSSPSIFDRIHGSPAFSIASSAGTSSSGGLGWYTACEDTPIRNNDLPIGGARVVPSPPAFPPRHHPPSSPDLLLSDDDWEDSDTEMDQTLVYGDL